MTIAEIVKIETDRQDPKTFGVVHLVKEGNFYHANDWSAWLLANFPVGVAKENPMTPTAKRLKNDYIHVFVGFPVSSLGKFVPQEETAGFNPVSDTQIDVTLNVDFGDATYDDVRKQVDGWKQSLPLSESRQQKRDSREASDMAPRITRISDIAARILSFQLAERSPMEAWQFLKKLQQDTAALF